MPVCELEQKYLHTVLRSVVSPTFVPWELLGRLCTDGLHGVVIAAAKRAAEKASDSCDCRQVVSAALEARR